MLQQYLPLAVLKLSQERNLVDTDLTIVATVLTACGIETINLLLAIHLLPRLQQYLPLAVLKLKKALKLLKTMLMLQQYLPLAVLKLARAKASVMSFKCLVATVLTACGIETDEDCIATKSNLLFVATVLTACGIETRYSSLWCGIF